MGRRIVLAFTAAALLLFGGAAAAGAQVPGNDGLLVFHSKRDGANDQIYTATRTGQTIERLTENSADDTDPAWSPDGTRIAFVSNRDGNREIYVMNADGSGQTRLTNHAGDDMDPAWSPDGSRIAIRRNIGGNNEIFLIDATDGGDPVNLTNHPASDFEPEFSPDGTKIAFQRYTAGSGVGLGNEVFLMNADGTGQVNLTDNVNSINDGRPSFSPDGSRIAFDSNRNDGRFELYSMKLDGSDVTRLTDEPGTKQNSAFAPSGSRIAFGGGDGIGIVPAAGGPVTTITTGTESQPHWQVDNEAPVTNIVDGPANGSTATVRTAEFEFAANEPETTFECRLDPEGTGGWNACTSPQEFSELADGEHRFEVRATDLGGNVETAPASRVWNVDATPPVVTIESGPNGAVASADAAVEFTVDDPDATVECRFDSAAEADWAECDSPWTRTELSEGDHTLEIRATDEAGNVSETATRAWTVDTVAPTVTITAAPDAVSNSVNATFEFTADEPDATFECRLDSADAADWASCTSPATWEELDDGVHSFEVRATDPAGNVSAVQAHSWKVTTVAPEAVITSGPDGLVNTDAATFEFETELPSATFECRIDSDDPEGWEPCESPKEYTDLGQGEHTFHVRATDIDQGTGPAASRSWTVDTVAPQVTIESGPAGLVASGDATVEFTVDDPDATVECRFDSTDENDWAECDSPWARTGLADGDHSLEIRATDEAGNVSAVASRDWTVDTVAPIATITTGPDAASNSVNAVFEFTADDPDATFECRLDSTDTDDWTDCESPQGYTGLADGAHTFEVRATDQAGNAGDSVSHNWEIATVKPVATITSGPDGLVNTDAASFEFESDLSTATFECRLDSDDPGGWEPCESPKEYTGLAQGEHTFEVRATDTDQGTGPAASRTWTVDTVAPQVNIDEAPSAVTSSADATVTFSTDDPDATLECRFDSTDENDWTDCESPWNRTGLDEGTHSLEIRATDQAGNTGQADVTWTIDRTAPVATFDAAPPAVNNSIRATFEFSADEPATFECRLDSTEADDWAECESPRSLNNLADGEHTFEVRATDQAGNTGDPVSHTWQVETVKPVATITSAPSDPTADDHATFEFNSDLPSATFECRIASDDPEGWEACESPVELTELADGEHTFEVRATDLDQGTGPAATATWTVDTVIPTVEITGKPAPISGTADPEFTFAASEAGTTAECRLDPADAGDPWVACSSPAVYTGLAEGSHRFEVRVTDAVGHTSEPAAFEWIVETTPPEVTVTSAPPESPTTFIDAEFTFESANPNAFFECRLDGSAWAVCESPVAYDQLGDATHTFEVRAVGHGAGPGPVESVTWTVDTVVPTVRITAGPNPVTASDTAAFEFELNKSGNFTFECALDGEPADPCDSPAEYTGLAAGDHTFRVDVLDQDGNVVDSATFEWTIVADAPEVTLTGTPPALSGSATAAFRFESNQPAAAFECELDGGRWQACTSPAAFTGLADGSHTVRIRAVLPGETGPSASGPAVEHTWQVDTTAPDVRISGGPNGTVTADSATFTVTSDDSSAVTECSLDGGPWDACDGAVELTGLADGPHELRVRSVDAAGNTGTDRREWTVDRATPQVTFTEAPEASTTDRIARFDFEASKTGSTFECRLDGGNWIPCSPVHTVSNLAIAAHTFEARATDRNGNTGDPATHSWDVVKPPVKGLVPTVKIRAKVKLDRDGTAPLAAITCPEGVCRITAPKRVTFRLKGRKASPGIKVVRTNFRKQANATLISSVRVRKLVARFGPVRVKVKIKVVSNNGKSRTATRRVKLVAAK